METEPIDPELIATFAPFLIIFLVYLLYGIHILDKYNDDVVNRVTAYSTFLAVGLFLGLILFGDFMEQFGLFVNFFEGITYGSFFIAATLIRDALRRYQRNNRE